MVLIPVIVTLPVLLPLRSHNIRSLRSSNINSLNTSIVILDDLELNFLSISEGTETVGDDGSLVNENVRGTIGGDDESESLLSVKPLDGTGFHVLREEGGGGAEGAGSETGSERAGAYGEGGEHKGLEHHERLFGGFAS